MRVDDETLPATPLDAPVANSVRIPTSIGRFAIERKLGEGGMGVVLLATDPNLRRRVAIKILRGNTIDDSAKRRLLREAQSMAQLSHENVIVVHEVGTHDDQVYVAMEFVAGETLARRQAQCTWREVLELYTRAGLGLQAAHDAGLVHRDFKPDNVLVGTDGRLRVTDFGLVASTGVAPQSQASSSVRTSELASTLTATGALMGTPRYMAPEQHRGEPLDARADQFAFCVALYEALYRQAPFAGTTYAELAANVLDAKRTLLPASDVPPSVRDAVLRGLSHERDHRHRSIRDLLALLSVDPLAKPRRRWLVTAGVAVGVVAIATAAICVAVRSGNPSAPPTPPGLVAGATSALDIASLKLAQQAFELGSQSFLARKYDDAAQRFSDAYLSLRVPQVLYDQGASLYMKAKRDGDAASYRRAAELYRQYLAIDPIDRDISEAVEAIGVEASRLEAGGERGIASPEIRALADPEIRGFALLISSPPGATVYIDDPAKGPFGVTPWAGTLDGAHEVSIAKSGFDPVVRTHPFDKHRVMVISALLVTR